MSATGLRAVSVAREWIGTPYLHQASAMGAGTDCLGLLRGIWRELYGAEPEPVPAYTQDWSEAEGAERLWLAACRHLQICDSRSALRPGEVLLFRMRAGSVAKHLGLAAESGGRTTFIHAYSGHGVVESPLSTPWARRVVARFEFP
ncbi:NlpC/P60 family protein [Defluviimonas sp. SAOS-178_SWC]|uniref:NlpC/P60 family protein n=1 Tax=Defluviimonas sp. SAOS-178_SWC TaxID=3121287 RepID=UPI0032214CEA